MAVGVNPIYRVGQNYGPQGRTKGTPAIGRAQQLAGAVGARGRQPYGPGTFPRVNPGGAMQGGNIGRFTRPSGFRGLAGLRGSAIDSGFGLQPNPNAPTGQPGAVGARPGQSTTPGLGAPRAPAINLGGGRGFRNAGQPRVQRTPVIQLGGRGIQPMRNPGVFATLAGRRAANANQANPIRQAKARANLNFTPRLQRQSAVSRARKMGQGF